jgi:transcriptional regulator with XRE-family HTH domain
VTEGAQSRLEPSSEPADLALGERIRHLRKARGKSLKELSTDTGLSISFVSQIERGLSSASVRTLARLADALEVGIGELFGPADDEADASHRIVARPAEHKRLEMPRTGAEKRWITPFEQTPRLDLYLISLEPGGSSGDDAYVHDGEEAGMILEGGMELIVDGRRHVLGEGDTFRFSSHRPHRFLNAGSRPARILWVNYRNLPG